jgi:DAACS family dicarboxylate/amino acid:cation (Na+ or H+) symporter
MCQLGHSDERVSIVTTARAIAIGLAAGLAVGIVAAATGNPALVRGAAAIAPAGAFFVRLLQMVVVPLVASVVFLGVTRLGNPRRLGRVGALTLAFFWSTTLVAIATGMLVMRAALPLASPAAPPTPDAPVPPRIPGVGEFLVSLVPANPVAAAAEGSLLPLIVFVACLAAATLTLPDAPRARLVTMAEAVADAMIQLVHWFLRLAPAGVFALAASVTATVGWAVLQNLAVFIAAVLTGLVAFYLLVYVVLVRALGGVAAPRYLRACIAPAALAMSTTSSAASLPALFESAESLGLSPQVSGFVLSLGAAINRAGSALFQGAAVVFLASLYGVPLPPSAIGGALVTTFLMSQTVAGIPSAGVMTLAPALGGVGVPLGGLALLLGVDRIPDMVRTATQVTGHLAAAIVVERRVSGRAPPPP